MLHKCFNVALRLAMWVITMVTDNISSAVVVNRFTSLLKPLKGSMIFIEVYFKTFIFINATFIR